MDTTITMSEPFGEIVAALAKAQGSFDPIIKNRTGHVTYQAKDGKPGGAYDFAYADLDAVLSSTKKGLSDNQIAHTAIVANGVITVMLLHPSNQWMKCVAPMPSPLEKGWQEFGKSVTYPRRILFCALVGVTAEFDDDANGADGNQLQPGTTGPDPLQPLWDALKAKGIADGQPMKEWCEMVLARAVPTPNTLFPKDVDLLLAVALGKAPMPQPHQAATVDPNTTPNTTTGTDALEGLRKALNTELTNLAPWGHAFDDMSAKERAEAKAKYKIAWANGLLPSTRTPITGFGQLSEAELTKLIGCAKAGEMPPTDADEVPDMQTGTPGGIK